MMAVRDGDYESKRHCWRQELICILAVTCLAGELGD